MKLFSLACAALVSLASVLPAAAADKTDKITVIQTSNVLLWAPMYIARERGYFRDEKIDAEVVIAKSGPEAMTAVLTGGATMSLGFPATPIRAAAKGNGVKMIGALTDQFLAQLLLRKDVADRLNLNASSPFKERVAALRGLTIATNGVGSAYDYLLRSMIKGAGMDPDRDVTLTPVGGGPEVLAALKMKRVDGIITAPPTDYYAQKEAQAFMLVDFAKGEYPKADGLLYVSVNATEQWLSANEDVAVRTLRALNRALKLIRDDPPAAKASVRTFFKAMSEESFDSAWQSNLASYSRDVVIKPKGVEAVLSVMAEGGEAVSPPFDRFYTNKYADKAVAKP